MELALTAQHIREPTKPERPARKSSASAEQRRWLTELKKTAHHSCAHPRTAKNAKPAYPIQEKDSLIQASVSLVKCTPDLREMVDNVLQTSAHRDKSLTKMVPVKTAKTLLEHSMKVRDAEILNALPEKFSKSTEGALLVTHTPEPPKMERLVYHMAVPIDKD